MAKRAKKALSVADHPTPPLYASSIGEDYNRSRYKIQSLQHDCEDLVKETDVMKRRLHETKHKKRVLLAQVKFLREKYRFLMENPRNVSFRPQRPEESHKMRPPKSISKAAHSEKSLPFHATTHAQHPVEIPQSSMRIDKAAASKETFSRKKFLGLDLNETSVPFMDEANEFHQGSWPTNPAASAWEKQTQLHHHTPESAVDTTGAADLKLSACRGLGKDASTRTGKRKITWQDQVALRV